MYACNSTEPIDHAKSSTHVRTSHSNGIDDGAGLASNMQFVRMTSYPFYGRIKNLELSQVAARSRTFHVLYTEVIMMDMGGKKKRIRMDGHGPVVVASAGGVPVPRSRREKKEERYGRAGAALVVCLLTLPLLVFFFRWRAGGAPAVWQSAAATLTPAAMSGGGLLNVSRANATIGATKAVVDELFGGLLAPSGSDRRACLSRHQSSQYYRHSPHPPSPHLLRKLRGYEARHSKCGPGTPLYAKSVEQLRSGRGSAESAECSYVVWLPYNGLGNRMLSLLSTFLYALLTDRVLLVHSTADFTDLFCEPFPAGTTWVLPPGFPVAGMSRLRVDSNMSYGNLLDAKKITNDPAKAAAPSMPAYVYLHLAHDLRGSDRFFYCNDDQLVLAKVNWLLLQNDFYFVPSLYAIAEFRDELSRLFPAKESVSHLLSRYLFHPSNSVWGMVTRYYHSYLAQAEERIGVQIRMFSFASIPVDDMYEQILACSRQEHILPDTDVGDASAVNGTAENDTDGAPAGAAGSTAILIASLHADYYERIKSTYYEHAAKGGGAVGVFQPSHEERQEMGRRSHNQKALAEIYLLSFSDVLLTTGRSTFGYMSSSLAGLRATMLTVHHGHKVPTTPCVRAVSMEPCFHMTPGVQCKGKAVDKEELDRHVKVCEDMPRGLKLVD